MAGFQLTLHGRFWVTPEDIDSEMIWTIINDRAQANKGVIPADQWTEPYMSREEMQREISDGVVFWGFEDGGELVGVMGIQKIQDVTLIRHSYVRSSWQKRGIGAQLLAHLRGLTNDPILVGTWADAVWAIRFYKKHGFRMVSFADKELLLRKYRKIPVRQIESSILLADSSNTVAFAVSS
jgi:GNAT superfamily N-acetyltransferase